MKKIFTLLFVTFGIVLNAQTNYIFQNDSIILDCAVGGLLHNPGGNGNSYNNNETFLFTVCPNSSVGESVGYDFNDANFGGGDYVCVYDGTTVAAPLLDCYNNVTPVSIDSLVRASSSNPTGCLTFQFYADGADVGDFEIDLFCVYPCQQMSAELAASSHPIVDTTYIDVCNGDTLTLTANGVFSENNLNYNQTNNNVSFYWQVGGLKDTSIVFSELLPEKGFYPVSLTMEDSIGCTTINEVNLSVRYLPHADFSPVFDSVICLGSTVNIFDQVSGASSGGGTIVGDTVKTANLFSVTSAAQYIPDDADGNNGNGITTPATYPIAVTGFIPGSVITNGNQVINICLDIEHSFAGDIDIVLVAPNGSQVFLVDMNPPAGPGADYGTPNPAVSSTTPGVPETYCWSPTATSPAIISGATYPTMIPPFPGASYQAFGNWDNFIGSPVNGIWTIQVFDDYGGDDGNIFGASFEFDQIFVPDADSFIVNYNATGYWDANPNIVSPLNQNTIQYTANTAGADVLYYNVDVQNFTCTDQDTVEIWVEEFTVSATPTDTIACAGDPVQLNAEVVGTISSCNYVFDLADSFGDGWNGNNLIARIDGVIAGTYTITGGSSATFNLTVPGGAVLELTYDGLGSFQNEVSYTVSTNGAVIFSDGPNPVVGVSFTTSCGGVYTYNWSPATDLDDTNIPDPISTLSGSSIQYAVGATSINNCTFYDTVMVNSAASFQFDAFGDTTICAGDTVQLFTTGGATSYIWTSDNGSGSISDTSAANPFVYPTTTTTYNVQADSTGCSQFRNITVEVSNIQLNNVFTTNATCGVANGGFILFAGGGLGALNYSIDGGANSQTSLIFNNLFGGNYNVQITDTTNCPLDTVLPIGGGGALLVIDSVYTLDPSCGGYADGAIQVFLTDTNAAVTYNNSVTGVTQASNLFTAQASGTYTITISDGSCPAIDTTITLLAPDTVLMSIDNSTNLTCYNDATGAITLSASGGSPNYTYSIDGINFQASGVFNTLDSGTYFLQAQDMNACSAFDTLVLSSPDSLFVSNVQIDSANCFGQNGTITITGSGGTAPLNYSIDGVPTFGSSNTFNVAAGNYTIQIQDDNNCLSNVALDTLYEPSDIAILIDSTNNSSCGVADGDVYISFSGGTGPYTFSWSDGVSVIATTEDLVDVAAGNYFLTITDANTCTEQISSPVSDDAPITLSIVSFDSVSCFGASDATVELSANLGLLPYTFTDNNGTPQADSVFTNLAGGNHVFEVTDANGCSETQQIFIFEPTNLVSTATPTNLTCNESANGEIEINTSGGIAPYFYALNTSVLPQTNNTFNNLDAGTYTAIISDTTGCLDTINIITVTEPDTLIITNVAVQDITCFGDNDGSFTVTATGGTLPYSYSVTGGAIQTSNIIDNLSGGTYTINVTDINNCPTATNIDSIQEPEEIVLTIDSTKNLTCNGSNNGYIEMSAVGGVAPLSYSTDGGANYVSANVFNTLSAGSYTLIVRDANMCVSNTQNVTLTEPAGLLLFSSTTDVSCSIAQDGSITLNNITGGTPGYQISFDGAPNVSFVNNMIFDNLQGGISYLVTVTDTNGCSINQNIAIALPPVLEISLANVVDVSCNGLSDANVELAVVGGTADYDFTFNGIVQTSTGAAVVYNDLNAGTYFAQVEDDNGCLDTMTINLLDPPVLTVDSITLLKPVSCFGAGDGALLAHVSGGYLADPVFGDYQYLWSPSGDTDHKTSGLNPGVHTITVTDDNNCSATASYTIDDVLPIIASITPDSSLISMGDTLGLGVTVQNAFGALTYSWSPTTGLSCTDCANPNATVYNDIVYSVVVTDSTGCTNYNFLEAYVYVDNSLFFFIPNSFTPNGDGINDNFMVFGQDIKSVSMMIYNRWGELVFNGQNQFETWDGTYQGVMQSSGVFTYVINVEFLNDATLQKNGSLTLIR